MSQVKVKKILVQNKEVDVYDCNPIDRMRHRDTDGDGICDFIDSNGYSKPNDKYMEISKDEYKKLQKAGFDVERNCRPTPNKTNNYILRFSDEQKSEIDTILKPVLRHTVSK